MLARHPLSVFLALAFGWSWCLALGGRALGGGAGEALLVAAQLGPSLAGLCAAWLCGGRAALRALASRARHWRVEAYWYAFALLGPILLWSVAFSYVAAVQPHSPAEPGGFWSFFPVFALQLALGGGLGQELGWRGFLQSTLEQRWSVVTASLAIGVIWAVWSAPPFLLSGDGRTGVGSLALASAMCVAYSLIFARILHETRGSVLVVALAHASAIAGETTWRAAVPALRDDSSVVLVYGAYLLGLALAALFVRIGSDAGTGRIALRRLE